MVILEDIHFDIELTSSAIEALEALGIAETKPRLEELVGSSWPEIRKRASKVLDGFVALRDVASRVRYAFGWYRACGARYVAVKRRVWKGSDAIG
jgi:hypothetical protein